MKWFINLNYRERWVLLSGTVLLVFILSYFWWWQPFIAKHIQLTHIIAAQQKSLQWMTQSAAEIQQLRQPLSHSVSSTNSLSLLTLIDKSMRQGTLNSVSKRIESKSNQEVQLHFEQVSFTELMLWLAQLYNQYQIQVDSIHIEQLTLPDKVKARLTLTMNN
ncbi:MAG: type II secretion system protein M [Thioploca sp.]|nr:type II secretion system protein M [Thioploca sp.]